MKLHFSSSEATIGKEETQIREDQQTRVSQTSAGSINVKQLGVTTLMESIKIISLEVEDKAGDERVSDHGVQSEKIVHYPLYLQYGSTQRESKGNS